MFSSNPHSGRSRYSQSQGSQASEQYNPATKVGELVGDRLILRSVLGTGTYGAVYSAIDNRTGEESAVKVLWKGGLDEEQLALQFMEVDINKRLSGPKGTTHPNIIAMRNFYEDPECVYLELELHKGVDLYDAIQKLGGLDDALAKHVFNQILSAVSYCHSRGVFHRDLKPENILVTDDWQCKLCDFGLASTDSYTTEIGCGSAPYMSPEARGGYLEKIIGYSCRESDVWSLGVVLLNILFGCNPWQVADDSDDAFRCYLGNTENIRTQFALSHDCYKLLASCFSIDPKERPTLETLRQSVAEMRMFVDLALLDVDVVLSSSPTDYPKRAAVLKHVIPTPASPTIIKSSQLSGSCFSRTQLNASPVSIIPFFRRLHLTSSSRSSNVSVSSHHTVHAY